MKSLSVYWLFFFPIFAIAQDGYLPLPLDSAEWTTLLVQSGHNSEIFTNYHDRPDGDTLIDGNSYTKLYRSIGKFYDKNNEFYLGAYRNVNNNVLFVPKDSMNAKVLYDFDINPGWILSSMNFATPGDTCNLTDSIPGCFYFQLESIDTITLSDSVPRRRYNFFFKESSGQEGFYHHSWIEGIGSTLGFFPDPNVFYSQLYPADISFSQYLLCHQQKDQLLYTDSNYYKGRCYRDVTEELYPYQPMAVEGAHWIVGVQRLEVLWLAGKYSFTVRGDTIVNEKNYKKVYQEYFEFDEGTKTYTNSIISSALYALIRDDTLHRKVYCIYINPSNETLPCPSGEEVLLFDFLVEEGDTLNWCSLGWQNGYPIVDSIRFGTFDWMPSLQRRAIYTKFLWGYGDLSEYTVAITEGIGYNVIGPFLYGTHLIDYCVGTDAQCGILSATKNVNLFSSFRVYPNPGSNCLLLENEHNAFEPGQIIRLFDLYGRLVLQQPYHGEKQQRMDISNLPNGIFLLEIVDQAGGLRYREKVLKLKNE